MVGAIGGDGGSGRWCTKVRNDVLKELTLEAIVSRALIFQSLRDL